MKSNNNPLIFMCIGFMLMIAFTSCQPATSDAATVHSFDSQGWRYDLTDEPYEDERLSYAIQGARLYWGMNQIPTNFRVLSMIATPTLPQGERGDVAAGMFRPYELGDNGAIWINKAFYDYRIDGKRLQSRMSLCTTVAHEIRHAMDPRLDLDPHRRIPEDPEGLMQGFAPNACTRLTPQDVLRKERRWCKRHKRECRSTKPDLAVQILRHENHR